MEKSVSIKRWKIAQGIGKSAAMGGGEIGFKGWEAAAMGGGEIGLRGWGF